MKKEGKDIIYKYEIFVPFRICPLGAHIDHQLGVISGFAIDKGIKMKYNKTLDGSFYVTTDSFVGEAKFYYQDLPKKSGFWQDYLVGSIQALKEKYELKNGIHAHVSKTIPIGGLASSSAIIICYLLAIAKVNDISLEENELVSLVVTVENKYMNTKVGILDPSCEIYSRKDHLLCMDPLNKSHKLVKSSNKMNFKICLIFSGITRNLPNTMYNVRVDECKTTAFFMNSIMKNTPIELKDSYLRNFSYDTFLQNKHLFPINLVKRATHFYSELDRVYKGIEFFQNGDLENFGNLITESGKSSIENYETGSEQLETLHNIVTGLDGVYGGRFSGAGFNGYYMALIDSKKEKEIKEDITSKYLSIYPQYKKDFAIYICNTNDGVKL